MTRLPDVARRPLPVALVDPMTLLGKDVKAVLTERAFPVSRLHLFHGGSAEDGLLTSDEEEIAYVAPLSPDALETSRIAFLCGSREKSERFLARRTPDGCLVIDLSGVRNGGPLAVPERELPPGDLFQTPDPTAYVVADLLAALDRLQRVDGATLVVDRPASELGKDALDELFQQAISLASFRPLPKDVLGGQLAFNAFYPEDSEAFERRVAEDVVRLLGRELPVSVFSARAGIFHGHHLRLEVRMTGGAPPAAEIASALFGKGSAYEDVDAENLSGPVESAGRDETLVLRLDSRDGVVRIGLASDHLRRGGAVLAVRLAEQAVRERSLG